MSQNIFFNADEDIEIRSNRFNEGNFEIFYDDGIYVKYFDLLISLDHLTSKADINFISHAHLDHVPFELPENLLVPKKISIGTHPQEVILPHLLMSKDTTELLKIRKNFEFSEEYIEFMKKNVWDRDRIIIGNLEFEMVPSGHILGSRALKINRSESKIMDIYYTGDFHTDNRFSFNGLKPDKCKNLIIECTYGHPKFKFPEFEAIIRNIKNFVAENLKVRSVIFLCYELGKAQLLLEILRDFDNKVVAQSIGKINEYYEKFGIDFGKYLLLKNALKRKMLDVKNCILIVPRRDRNKPTIKNLVNSGSLLVEITGWTQDEIRTNNSETNFYFPLSDHVDLIHLLNFIKSCNPANIFLYEGYVKEFRYFLKKSKFSNKLFVYCLLKEK